MTDRPDLKVFAPLLPLSIQQYESVLPTAFDESLTLLQKVNKVIQSLWEMGELVNGVVANWNAVMEWIISAGLEDVINKRLDQWLTDGTLDDIINKNIFGDLNKKIDDLTKAFDDFKLEVEKIINNSVSNEGTPDEVTARLQKALDDTDGFKVIALEGVYNLNAPIIGHSANILSRNAELRFSNAGDALTFVGTDKNLTINATAGYTQGRNYLLVQSVAGVEVGDLIRFISTTEMYNPSRGYFYKGTSQIITDVGTDRLYFADGLTYDINAVDTIEIYKPAIVNIDGRLNIVNTGDLPNGQKGLYLQRCANSNIKGVNTDNFDTNISITFSTYIKLENCKTLRAYYANTPQSYGIAIISSNHVITENVRTRSGNHGITHGGWEPVDFVKHTNGAFFNEPPSTFRSFDAHNNMINMLVENCEMDAFQVSGNVDFKNIVVHQRSVSGCLIAQADEFSKANYSFDGLEVRNGGHVDVGAYAQSGGDITNMTRIGNISIKNTRADVPFTFKANQRAYGSAPVGTIHNVEIVNAVKMAFQFGDNIDNLKIDNLFLDEDITCLYQLESDSRLLNGTFNNCVFPARYMAVTIQNARRITFLNCLDISVGNATPRMSFAGVNTNVGFINCNFPNFTEGVDLSVDKYFRLNSSFVYYGTPSGTNVTALG